MRGLWRGAGAALVAALAVVGAPPARAQFFGAGSTVQGDILRGEGIAAWGFGQYNLATAMAGSINTDTAIRLNQYLYLSIEEDLHKKFLHRQMRQQRDSALEFQTEKRLREAPNRSDLYKGDALNITVKDLLNPKISRSNYRSMEAPQLDGDVIRTIPFTYAAGAATFSMERLLGRKVWPLCMRGPEFRPEREAYKAAVDAAIEQAVEDKLTQPYVLGIERAVKGLSDKIDLVVDQTRTEDLKQARNFVKQAGDVCRLLQLRQVERVLVEMQTYSGKNVADLVLFMERHRLQFGVADSPDETTLYPKLYAALQELRARIPDAAVDTGPTK